MLDLSAQKGVEQFGCRLFDGNQILDKQDGKQQKQIGIPCRMVQNKVNDEANKG